MDTTQPKAAATAAQVRLFKTLYAQAGLVLATSRLRRFKALTVGQASLEIQRVKSELDASALTGYSAPQGMATAKQLAYFSKLRLATHRLRDTRLRAGRVPLRIPYGRDFRPRGEWSQITSVQRPSSGCASERL